MAAADPAAIGMFFIPGAYALDHHHGTNIFQSLHRSEWIIFSNCLCVMHPGVFSIEVFLGSHLFPAGGKDQCPVVEELLFILMADLRPIMPILLLKPENLCLGKEMDRAIALLPA